MTAEGEAEVARAGVEQEREQLSEEAEALKRRLEEEKRDTKRARRAAEQARADSVHTRNTQRHTEATKSSQAADAFWVLVGQKFNWIEHANKESSCQFPLLRSSSVLFFSNTRVQLLAQAAQPRNVNMHHSFYKLFRYSSSYTIAKFKVY